MSFSTLHKLVAYLISGLGLFALSLGSELESDVLALMFVGYVGSSFAEGALLQHRYYAKGWTAAVVLLLFVQLSRAISDAPTLAMAIEFAAMLQISRLANRRTAADYQQIAVLAFLHLIAATVLSTSLSYALIFFGFVIATPWMLALSQLRREIEGNYPAVAATDGKTQAAVKRVLASKRVVGGSFLFSTALLALPLFAMTLTIFVIVPRVGQGFLSLRRHEGQRVTGFGNQVELGGFGVIRDDPTVVLRVAPLAREGVRGQMLSLRLRGTSFDRYDGRRWTRSKSDSETLAPLHSDHYPLRRVGDPERDQLFRIMLDHLDEAVVFLPYGTVAVSVLPRIVQGEQFMRRLVEMPGLDLRYADPDELGLVYTAFVSRNPREADVLPVTHERRASYLQVPPGHERIAELARTVTAGAQSAAESAERIVTYLHSSRFSYSLDQPNVGDKLPLDVFLFEAKRGHCEYFASAMAVMLRTLGIPARNVTGFIGGRYNPYGGYYALRQGDAHSWVEAYVEGRGWVTYDPTPSSRAELGQERGLWSDLQALIDAMRTRWMTSVVGYDLRTQVGILRKLGRFFASRDQSSGGVMTPSLRGGLRSLRRLGGGVFFGIGAVVLCIALVVWRARRRRGGEKERPIPPDALAAVKLYQDLDRALAACGHVRPASTTPTEHARALEAEGFACAREVREITERYMLVRYGGATLPKSQLPHYKAALARIRAEKHNGRPSRHG